MGNELKIREAAKKLNPIDDLMFRKMAEEPRFCEEILRVILSDSALVVTESRAQYDVTNLQGRSVILDAHCILSNKKHIEVEVQKSDDDNHQRRMRYNGAVLTANITEPGIKFEKVPDVCVVFISRFDIFKKNLPIYHIDRIIRETKDVVDNGFSEIYVNTKVKDGSEVSELMKIFVDDDAYSSKFPVISEIKYRFKETEEGQKIMCEIMEKIRKEAEIKGIERGKAEEKIRINSLNTILIDLGRYDDLKRASKDIAYQEQLMSELLPKDI